MHAREGWWGGANHPVNGRRASGADRGGWPRRLAAPVGYHKTNRRESKNKNHLRSNVRTETLLAIKIVDAQGEGGQEGEDAEQKYGKDDDSDGPK